MPSIRLAAGYRKVLHELVDSIGLVLEVPVELTDRQLTTLARSERAPMDGMLRSFRPDLSPRVTISSGRHDPIQVPAVEEIGLPGFWVVPVYGARRLRALLWILDGTISADAVNYAAVAANATIRGLDAAGAFERDVQSQRLDAHAFSEHLDDVEQAVSKVMADGTLQADSVSVALAIAAEPASAHFAIREDLAAVLRNAVERGAAVLPEGRAVAAQEGTEAVVLLAPFPQAHPTVPLERATAIVQDLMYRSQDRGLYRSWSLGSSSVVRHPGSPGRAIWQARQAARTGRRLELGGRLVEWKHAERYHGLPELPRQFLDDHFLTTELHSYFDNDANEELVATLESYLEHAGNVQAVAAERYLHRTNVYHRLRRIEADLGFDLGNGHDRLALHMALIAWRVRKREHSTRSATRLTRPLDSRF